MPPPRRPDPVAFALALDDPERKCAAVAALEAVAAIDPQESGGSVPAVGRPVRVRLVSPREVPSRGLGTPAGRAALIHAVAHIEFNAINLALDAACRFAADLPGDFRTDWIGVAQDEARHFTMLSGRLSELGHAYGDFPAHNGLWEAAEKTAHDVLSRMALVPRVLEARGLDVTPGMILRLEEVGDPRTAAILRVILEEEVRHVAIGTRWFRHLCERRGVEPVATFEALLLQYGAKIREPINRPARMRAGFVAEELPLLP